MESIQIHPFTLNALEYAKAYEAGRKNYSRKEMRIFYLLVAVLVLLAISPLFIVAIFLPGERSSVFNALLVLSKLLVGIVVVFYVIFPLILRIRLWIALKINPQLFQKAVVTTFLDQGVDFVTENSQWHINWSYYRSAKESRDFFLLFAGKGVFNAIPKKALEPVQINELRVLLKEKISNYKDLS